MTVPSKHGIYGASIGGVVLGSIMQQSIVSNNDVQGEPTSGEIYSRLQALMSQKIVPSFTTRAVATALGACGATGLSLSTSPLILYGQKYESGGGRAAGSTHRSFTFQHGILFPGSLSVSHRQDATLSYSAVVTHDGTHDPVVIGDAVALPPLVEATQEERYAMGPMTLGGVTFTGKTSWSLDFGIDVVSEGADNTLWDTFAAIRQVQPVLTLSGLDLEWIKAANIPLTGKQANHLTTSLYLQHRDPDGSYVADATETHVKLTACGLIVPENLFEGDGGVSIRMPLKYDGTNSPLVIDTTSPMPT